MPPLLSSRPNSKRISWPLHALRALIPVGLVVAATHGCATQLPLGKEGAVCDYDQQCAQPLVCRCVVIAATDDEGGDNFLADGFCGVASDKCSVDGGLDANGTFEASPDVAAEGAADVAIADAGTDAIADAAADGSNDAEVDAANDGASDSASETADVDAANDGG